MKSTGSVPVAVKSIKQYEEPQERRNFFKEQAAMREMAHPNVVRLYGFIERGILHTGSPTLYAACKISYAK